MQHAPAPHPHMHDLWHTSAPLACDDAHDSMHEHHMDHVCLATIVCWDTTVLLLCGAGGAHVYGVVRVVWATSHLCTQDVS